MQELRGKVAALRGELESFSKGVPARLEPIRTEVNALVGKIESVVAALRPEVDSAGKMLTQKIESLDAELAKMEP